MRDVNFFHKYIKIININLRWRVLRETAAVVKEARLLRFKYSLWKIVYDSYSLRSHFLSQLFFFVLFIFLIRHNKKTNKIIFIFCYVNNYYFDGIFDYLMHKSINEI